MSAESESPTGSKSKEELLEATKEHFDRKEAKQQDALEAIAQGQDLEGYATVELGQEEMEVKKWIPGTVEQEVGALMEAVDEGRKYEALKRKDDVVKSLATVTENDLYDRGFWSQYYERWGYDAIVEAINTVLTPAVEEREEKAEAVDGFRGDGEGNIVRAGNRGERS